jgi:hypothetical protein
LRPFQTSLLLLAQGLTAFARRRHTRYSKRHSGSICDAWLTIYLWEYFFSHSFRLLFTSNFIKSCLRSVHMKAMMTAMTKCHWLCILYNRWMTTRSLLLSVFNSQWNCTQLPLKVERIAIDTSDIDNPRALSVHIFQVVQMGAEFVVGHADQEAVCRWPANLGGSKCQRA